MALETLKGVTEIGGFQVLQSEDGNQLTLSKENPICICHESNTIHIKIQNGPIKENGVNGCQVQTICELGKKIVEGLNANFPCRENSMMITKIDEAIMWSKKRTEDREARGVEGEYKS